MRPGTLLVNLNLANQLTFLRLVAIPFFIIAVLQSRFAVALGLFLGAALTDLLDGLTARVLHQGTPLGAYLDPAADKLLLTAGFVLLTDYPSMLREVELVQRIPIWLTILTISRDVIIVSVALVLFLTLQVKRFAPSLLGKLCTTFEFLTVCAFLAASTFVRPSPVLDVLVWTTLCLTLLSGLHYLERTIRLVSPAAAGAPGGSRRDDD